MDQWCYKEHLENQDYKKRGNINHQFKLITYVIKAIKRRVNMLVSRRVNMLVSRILKRRVDLM